MINLIRRKVVDVDKQLAKRLKSLVKQWQQLLQNKLPNGATPTTGVAMATLNSVDGSTTKGEFPHYNASPYRSSSSLSSSAPDDPTYPQLAKGGRILTSGSSSVVLSESEGSLEVNHSQEPPSITTTHSWEPPSITATPPLSSTTSHGSHPSQTTPTNRTKNRSEIIKMLSSIKRPSPSPSKDTNSLSKQIRSISSEPNYHPRTTLDSSSLNVPTTLAGRRHPFSSSPSPSLIADNEVGTSKDFVSSNSLLSLPGSRCSSEEVEVTAERIELNGSRDKDLLDVIHVSQKRQRSYSPLTMNSSMAAPPHKKHKRHKHSSPVIDEHLELVVHVPLARVRLKDHRTRAGDVTGTAAIQDSIIGPVHDVAEVGLVVSILLSMLSRIPSKPVCVPSKRIETDAHLDCTTSFSPAPLHLPNSLPPPLPSLVYNKDAHRTGTDSNKHTQSRLNHNENDCPKNDCPTSSPKMAGSSENTASVCQSPPPPPPDLPPGVRLGIDGCIGRDGRWYGWTDHIPSTGPEVTILPYVYIDY